MQKMMKMMKGGKMKDMGRMFGGRLPR